MTDQDFPGHRGLLWRQTQDLKIFENAEAALIDAWKTTDDRAVIAERTNCPTTAPIAEVDWKDAPVTTGARSKDARTDVRLLCYA
jgi:hypothetical protein